MRNTTRSIGPARQRGQILIIVGLSLIVLVGMVGVALDSGRGYAVKARLNAAVDAASIGAARAISEGATDSARIANAQAAARRFFDLNFPANYFGAARPTPAVNAVRDAERRWAVTVSATAEMPTTFARVLGRRELDVFAQGQTVRRQLDVMLVMDVSGSLGSPSTAFPRLKNAAKNSFVSKFSSDDDRVGLVSFSSGAVVDVPIRKAPPPALGRGFNRTQVVNAIDALVLGGATASAEGMRLALSELEAIPATLRSDLRVILFFSDGAPNVVSATYPRSSAAKGLPNPISGNLYSETGPSGSGANKAYRMWHQDYRFQAYSPSDSPNNGTSVYDASNNPNITSLPLTGRGNIPLASYNGQRTLAGSPYTNNYCNVNRAARNMVENVANAARSLDPPVYVYTIGLGDALENLEVDYSCSGYSAATEKGSVILNRLANSTSAVPRNPNQPTGQYCWAQTDAQLDSCFSRIASEVLRLAI